MLHLPNMVLFSSSKSLNVSSVHLPVSSRGDEVNATVDSGVWNPFLPVDIDLLLQVCLILVINELHDGLPAKWDEWRG